MHPADEKTQLRRAIEQRLRRMTDAEKAAASRSVCRRILEHLPADATICAYNALATEVDLTMLLNTALERGQTVYLPCFADGVLEFRQFTKWEDLTKGTLGIREPVATNPVLEPTDAGVVLVPGRAFTRHGYRLGRGNGGYDLWIHGQRKAHPNTQYWGVAFDSQLVTELPTESHDEQMDAIVTPREFTPVEPNKPNKPK